MNEGRELHRTLSPRNKTSLQNKGLAEALPSLPGVDPIPQESTQGSWLFRIQISLRHPYPFTA